jgi:general secretion pathway protein K
VSRLVTRNAERGVVLALVLVLAMLLSVSIIGFTRRAVMDTMIVSNRDNAARAAALARGGIRLASAVLTADRLAKNVSFSNVEGLLPTTPGNTEDDLWNQVRNFQLVDKQGGQLRIEIHDAGGLLNLNAVVPYTGTDAPVDSDAEEFLTEFLTRVVDDMPIEPGEKIYDPRELARNLIDYMDIDEFRMVGGSEDDYYLSQDPPYRAANRPLLSVEEVGLVEGFDVQLADAIKPYATVYPVVDANGININTAPPHVLSLLYSGVAGDRRFVDADTVGRILRLRAEGRVVCTKSSRDSDCMTLSEVNLGEGSVFPPTELPDESASFTVLARATVGSIERSIVAVLDRSELLEPQLLFWRMQ